MIGFYYLFGVRAPFDPEYTFVTSPFLSTTALAAVRLTLAFYATITTIFVLAWDTERLHTGRQFFSFFTELSYIGLLSYFWAAAVQTLAHATTGGKRYPLQGWPRPLQLLHTILTSTIMTFPIIVTVVFWALLASSSTFSSAFSSWSNISMHALNTVFALFEITCTRARPGPWAHCAPLVLILALYLAVAYITHATQHFYPYDFLDPTKQHAKLAAYIIGIPVAECLLFTLIKGVVFLRDLSSRRRTRAAVGEAGIEDDWQELEHPPPVDAEKEAGSRSTSGV